MQYIGGSIFAYPLISFIKILILSCNYFRPYQTHHIFAIYSNTVESCNYDPLFMLAKREGFMRGRVIHDNHYRPTNAMWAHDLRTLSGHLTGKSKNLQIKTMASCSYCFINSKYLHLIEKGALYMTGA